MKKSVIIVLICFAILLVFSLFNGVSGFTGQITKENIITSVSPQGEVDNKAFHINVFTSERATCMYSLSIKGTVGFNYYTTITETGEFQHSQLLKNIKSDNYVLGIKCSDMRGFASTSNINLVVKVPETCVPYCEYTDICDEYAIDGCDLLCKRDTDSITCSGNNICNNGFCVNKETIKPAIVKVSEQPAPTEKPFVISKTGNILDRILSFLRGIFRQS